MKKRLNIYLICLFVCFGLKSKAQCNGWFPFFSSGTYNCLTNQAVGVYTINGNAPPITYTIVNSITNATFYIGVANANTGSFIPVPVGSYNVYGGNATPGCTFTTAFSVSSPISPANISFSTSVPCPGGSNGNASAFPTAPLLPPFTYTWSNGAFGQTAPNLSAGLYSVTVQDINGCAVTNTILLTDPPPIVSSITKTRTTCYLGTLTTTITATGGTSPYTFTINGNAVAGNTVSGLSAGVHTIITSDFKGCLKTNTVLITQPPQPLITFSVTKPSCAYSTNGAVSASVTNAPPAYSYTWQPIAIFASSLTNIPIGNYTLTVRDGSACTTKSVINVSPANSMTSNVTSVAENCSAADGSFTINVSGGSAPLTYSTLTIGSSTNNFVTGLSSGAYTTIVTDGGNCKDTVKFVIGNLSTVSVSIVSFKPVLCFGQCSGSVQVSVQNAVAPVTYSATGTPTTLSNVITNLCSGVITIKAIDNIGCPATTTINFPAPPAFSYSAANPPPVCVGKTFTLQGNASGGSGGYSYVWNPGSVNGQTVSIISGATTVYSLNVYDSNGCTLAPFTVTVNVNEPISINLNSSNSGICPGTTAQITPTVAGGDGNYTYNWVPGNLNSSSIFVQNITVPVYTLFVNDACGSPTAIKIVTINLFPSVVPTFSVASNSGCEPFCTKFISTTPKATNVIWNYGDKPFEQTGNLTNYCYEKAGIYNLRLTVNDSNNCKAIYTYTNVVNVLKAPETSFITEPLVVTTNNMESVLIKNTTSYGNNYQWFVNGVFKDVSKNITYSFPDTGCVKFRLIASNNNNCFDTLDKSICVIEGFNFWIPNSFSPNSDGRNDVFVPLGSGWADKDYSFEIYNRWGKQIFKTSDPKQGWDGKTKGQVDPLNTYYWRAVVTDILNETHELKGFVLLLE